MFDTLYSTLTSRVFSLFVTCMMLFGLPYFAYSQTERPYLEWTFIVGIFVTCCVIYLNGSGYRVLVAKTNTRFYHSASFWVALSYTLVVSYLSYTHYHQYF